MNASLDKNAICSFSAQVSGRPSGTSEASPASQDVTWSGTRQRCRLATDCSGATQFEYAVLFVVISVATVGAWVAFGQAFITIF